MFYFIQNVAIIGQNLWLSDWTEDSVEYFNTTYPAHIRDTRLGVFGALGLAQGMSRKRFKKCFHKKNEIEDNLYLQNTIFTEAVNKFYMNILRS